MAWTTPVACEVCVGMEVTAYRVERNRRVLISEFSFSSREANPPSRPRHRIKAGPWAGFSFFAASNAALVFWKFQPHRPIVLGVVGPIFAHFDEQEEVNFLFGGL